MNTLTPEAVKRSRALVEKEHEAATRAHEKAAYSAASKPSDETRAAMSATRRAVGDLRAELEAMDAVEAEACRLRKVAAIEEKIGAEDAKLADGIAQVSEAFALYEQADGLLREFVELHAKLVTATKAVALAEHHLRAAGHTEECVPDGRSYQFKGPTEPYFQIDQCIEALLWPVFDDEMPRTFMRSELNTDSCGRRDLSRALACMGQLRRKSSARMYEGHAKRVAKLKNQLAEANGEISEAAASAEADEA